MKEPNITVITSIYSANKEFLKKISDSIKSQDYSGKITHIFINDNIKKPLKIKGLRIINNNENIGLAGVWKKGFEIAKTEIIVSLMDDCLPASDDWLVKLINPLKNKDVAATSSKVELPKEFWGKFDFFARALTEKEQKIIIMPNGIVDEKGCAYKKSTVESVGGFDTKNFKNGGEDADLSCRLCKNWRIVSSEAKTYHLHNTNLKKRIKKEVQYAQIAGIFARKCFFKYSRNSKLHIVLKVFLFLILLASLFFKSINFWLVFLGIFILANLRFPFQFARLWKNPKILLVPFLNLFVYFLYTIFFLRALIFKPVV
jgi:GT2 family glycosyltransferase